MKTYEWVGLLLSAIAIIVVPMLGLLVRGITKWTKVESQMGEVVRQIQHLVTEKDKTHGAMLEQMRADRDNADRRLRWLEEHLWGKGKD